MSERLVLGTRKGLFLLEARASGWQVVRVAHRGAPIAYAEVDPRTGVLWACIDYGHWGQKLARSSDLSETWEPVPSPKYPESARIRDGFPGAERIEVPATLRYLWVVGFGGAEQPERVYLGTEPGGLFRSDDGGSSFHLVEGLWDHPSRVDGWFGGGRDHPGIHSIVVDPRDSRHLFVGISCGGVFESTDDGATWSPRNRGVLSTFMPDPTSEIGADPHFLAACTAAPDVLWQQNHCGIYRSVDAGNNWRAVSREPGPAHFGFTIAADPRDPGIAWVVPATSDGVRTAVDCALCVCRTEDGGESWQTFRAGLPQEHCFDIVYRHALALSGNRLAFGTTTGNAFVSDDRGESWQCLGNYLPPVYSARFVPNGV